MLTLQFVPYSEIEPLNTDERIEKIMSIVKGKNIVLMQGRLRVNEETRLIQETMEQIDKNFKGIEICTIYPEDKEMQALRKIKKAQKRISKKRLLSRVITPTRSSFSPKSKWEKEKSMTLFGRLRPRHFLRLQIR